MKIKRPTSLPGWLFLLVVLGAMVAGIWHFQVIDVVNPNSPRATAKAFMRAVYIGNIDRAGELCTGETQPLLAPLKQAARLVQSRAQTRGPRRSSWRATAVGVAGDRATVTIAQTLRQGESVQSSEFPLTLAAERGTWKVDLAGGPDGGRETVMGLSGLVGWR